jgi:hypothetical protein
MSNFDYDTAVNYLPKATEKVPVPDEKFLFFFDPQIVDEKFLFGLPLKTGVFIFSAVVLIQALSALFEIFSPDSFWIFLVSIFAALIYFGIAFYAFFGATQNNYLYLKTSYLVIAFLFLIEALKYICKSIYKTIEFITPWDGDFLRLDFLIYIFGYGVYLLIYLYLIYVLYRFMLEVKNGGGQRLEDNNENNLNMKIIDKEQPNDIEESNQNNL